LEIYINQSTVLTNSTTIVFTLKFRHLQIPPLLLLLPNSITSNLHTPLEIILYLQIPVLANSITCKFTQYTWCLIYYKGSKSRSQKSRSQRDINLSAVKHYKSGIGRLTEFKFGNKIISVQNATCDTCSRSL